MYMYTTKNKPAHISLFQHLRMKDYLVPQTDAMKKISLYLVGLLAVAMLVFSCGKKNDSTPDEAGVTAQTTPAINSNNLNQLGPDFPLKVEITSAMPPKGVKIDISASKDGSSDPAYFTTSSTTSAPENNFTITSTPSGVTCVVNITVTSVTKSSNVWKGQYRYSKK